jgi:phosphoglycerate dehydrogenase-like enzyme
MTPPADVPTPLRVLWRAAPPEPQPTPADLPPGCELVVEPDETRALERRDAIDVLIDGRPGPLLDGASLSRVIVPWAGLPAGLRQALLERPHLKAHNAHYNAPFVAQHALALLLAAANRLVPIDAALRRGDWGDRDRPERSRQLAGGEALLLGYGAIGRRLAPMLQGLGMRVTALRRRPTDDEGGVRVIGLEELAEALGRTDALLVSLPATPVTTGLIGREALAQLKSGAVIVNVGRGAVIDEAALFEALRGGHVAGAGLDVWWRYPEGAAAQGATLPATHPFWELPNVVLSPHRADASDTSERARVADVCATLRAIAEGRERSRLDVEAGY